MFSLTSITTPSPLPPCRHNPPHNQRPLHVPPLISHPPLTCSRRPNPRWSRARTCPRGPPTSWEWKRKGVLVLLIVRGGDWGSRSVIWGNGVSFICRMVAPPLNLFAPFSPLWSWTRSLLAAPLGWCCGTKNWSKVGKDDAQKWWW